MVLKFVVYMQLESEQICDYKALCFSHKSMIPINNRCLKGRILKETQIRMPQMAMSDYCPHLQNPIENFVQNYLKNQLEIHDSHNFISVPADEYFYDPNFSIKSNWYINNNNCYEDFCQKIKREEEDQQKLWPHQIKDEQSFSANHEGFQACEVPKQEEVQYVARCSFEDPNKFLGPCLTASREEKNHRRKLKVQAYLKKKSMRSFSKKIIYKCRKQVADNRIRYRGRFISLSQAASILKLNSKQNYTSLELMQKLKAHNHADDQKQQKKDCQKPVEEIVLEEDQQNKHIINQKVFMEAAVKRNEEDQ